MNHIQNKSPDISSIVASCGYRSDHAENIIPVTVYGQYIATTTVYTVIT
jgi:hypothetical protein